MFYKTLACTAALSFALSTTAFAQDKSATKPTNPKTEDVDAKASGDMYLKLGPIKGESQDRAMVGGSGGEDRLTEDVSMHGGGKVDAQDINIINYAKNPKIDSIKGESVGKVHKDEIDVLIWDQGDQAPACVTEAGERDADCNGVGDPKETRYERGRPARPSPRMQRR